jgi:membrane associated rhomboid family serine protease
MGDYKNFKYTAAVIWVPSIFVIIMWSVYWIELRYGYNFNRYGIYPEKISGLKGILFSPFIHSGVSHLFNNSVPLIVLTACLFFFYRKIAFRVLIVGTIFTGFSTWLIAKNSYHIGASGIVYMLFSFIFFSGIMRKHYRLVALSLMIVFLYGGMIWYIFPIKERMSWEGHLSGFIIGLVLSLVYKRRGPQNEEYHFKQTPFDLMFDESGNFNPPKVEEEKESEVL